MRILSLMIFLVGMTDLAYGQMSATTAVTQGKRVKTQSQTASKWSASSQLSYSKNQDYYSDAFTSLSVGVGYELSERSNVYIETGYAQPLSTNSEKVDRYGFSDLELGLNFLKIYTNRYNFSVGAVTALNLPTSKISRESSLNVGWSGGLATSTPLQYGFTVSSSHIVLANWYQYETSDKAGFDYNYPYGFANSLALRWSKKSFYTSTSFGLTYLRDYSDTDINIQSVRGALGYSFPKQVSAEIFGRWKDQVLTNNSVFDEDNTYFGFLLTVAL